MLEWIDSWITGCLDNTWQEAIGQEIGPGMFSGFHLLWLGIMVVLSVAFALILGRRHKDLLDRIVIGVFALILVMCELFKQQFWYKFYGYYRWEIFPFQFCSVPIYVSVFATLAPWKQVREVCYRFLAFFGIIGGLAVMAVPTAVLYTYFVPMSIHSMIWHTVLVVMGVYLIVSRGYGRKLKELLSPFVIFMGFVVTAIIGNVLVYKLHLGTAACQPGDNLSMFYISPYYDTQLPLLGVVQDFSYPLFVLAYIAFFTSLTLLVWGVSHLCRRRVKVSV